MPQLDILNNDLVRISGRLGLVLIICKARDAAAGYLARILRVQMPQLPVVRHPRSRTFALICSQSRRNELLGKDSHAAQPRAFNALEPAVITGYAASVGKTALPSSQLCKKGRSAAAHART